MKLSTQQAVNIAGIKDGIAILKDGGYRIVMSVSAVNFALKSEQEQNSLIFQYQSFLNSLHFPIEIVMRSKRLDLSPYLKKITDLAAKQENELLKIQTEDYIDFVTKLIELANIMKKNFYVAIPFQPTSLQNTSFINKIFKKEKTVTELRITESEFKRNSDELKQRASVVASGLGGMGLHCVQLNTEEIIELFYQIYNPEEANKERITDVDELSAPVIIAESEKPADAGKIKEEEKAKEEVIDNTGTLEEKQKQDTMLRHQEMMKEGERQIGMSKNAERSTQNATTNNEEPRAQNLEPGAVNSQLPSTKSQINSNDQSSSQNAGQETFAPNVPNTPPTTSPQLPTTNYQPPTTNQAPPSTSGGMAIPKQ